MNSRILRFFQTSTKKPPSICIMRHAESTWNAGRRRVQGASTDPGIVLSPYGIQSIHALLKNVPKPDVLICSPLLRCKQTAEIWFGSDFENISISKKLVPDLKEINAGIFEHRYLDELTHDALWKSWLKNPAAFPGFPQGETSLAFQERVLNAFSNICIEFADTSKNVCVITHGIVMRALLIYLKKKDLSQLWEHDVKNLERLLLTPEHISTLKNLSTMMTNTCKLA